MPSGASGPMLFSTDTQIAVTFFAVMMGSLDATAPGARSVGEVGLVSPDDLTLLLK